jgi:hypothetical protein
MGIFSQEWGEMIPGQPHRVNTYAGHKWNVKYNGEIILRWVIDSAQSNQRFVVTVKDVHS